MGDRYFITGVQLGMLKGFNSVAINTLLPLKAIEVLKYMKELLDEIEEKQFTHNTNKYKLRRKEK